MAGEGPPVQYRPATEADLEAEARIFLRAEGALVRRHNFDWSDRPVEVITPTLGHLVRHDAGRCWVAERDGHIVGYTAALVRGDLWFFASLFVDPDAQGLGIGPRLFELAHDGAPRRQATLTDSFQPVSNTIYARGGLVPTTPMLAFEPPTGGAPLMPRSQRRGDGRIEPVTRASEAAADLRALDERAYGADRAIDHAFLQASRTLTLWADDRDVVAYSYLGPNGRVGPLAGRDEATAAAVLRLELDRNPTAWVEVPGTARAMVAAALDSGRRLSAPVGLLLLSSELAPPTALAIADWFLF